VFYIEKELEERLYEAHENDYAGKVFVQMHSFSEWVVEMRAALNLAEISMKAEMRGCLQNFITKFYKKKKDDCTRFKELEDRVLLLEREKDCHVEDKDNICLFESELHVYTDGSMVY